MLADLLAWASSVDLPELFRPLHGHLKPWAINCKNLGGITSVLGILFGFPKQKFCSYRNSTVHDEGFSRCHVPTSLFFLRVGLPRTAKAASEGNLPWDFPTGTALSKPDQNKQTSFPASKKPSIHKTHPNVRKLEVNRQKENQNKFKSFKWMERIISQSEK